MLQGLRDSLKGTVIATVIVLFFVLPMVVAGVGSSWLGSVAGTDAASVNGEVITKQELSREVFLQKQRLLSQEGVDPSADYLKDENLQKPVLDRLTKKTAILSTVEGAGMAASDSQVNSMIKNQPEFQVDDKFDPQTYRTLLSRIGSSPAMYKQNVAETVVLQQLDQGLGLSAFVTEAEKSGIIGIIHEKRSFYTVNIPSKGLAEAVVLSDEDIRAYYQENQTKFVEPERVEINYIELSVGALARQMQASDEEVKAQYDLEMADFDLKPEVEVAHILIEDGAGAGASKVAEVQAKLAAGEPFDALAKVYSDDAGSKTSGGSLGVMVSGVFPAVFEQAVAELDDGEVSEPVETDSGIHIIKVLSKKAPEPPTFDERKDAIAGKIKRTKAEEEYTTKLELLEELTFSAPSLESASQELGLPIRSVSPFERTAGNGIADFPEIRTAAFSPEVLTDGHNSRVIELANNRSFVLRVKQHLPEHVRAFESVTEQISKRLTQSKVDEQLRQKSETLLLKLKEGASPESFAEEMGYEYKRYERVTRTSPDADPETRRLAFSAPVVAGEISYQMSRIASGDYRIVGVMEKVAGAVDELETIEIDGITTQLKRETGRYEGSTFQEDVIASAEVEVY